MGKDELAALEAVFAHLADKYHGQAISTLLKLSKLPQKAPKTFGVFYFWRIRGRGTAALRKLPVLSHLHARKSLAFIIPGRIGKTHPAQAYGKERCPSDYKTYCLKATELCDKLKRTTKSDNSTTRAAAPLVKPSRLNIDKVGRRTLGKAHMNPFFASDGALPCTLDRLFDRTSVFAIKERQLPRCGARDIFSRIITDGDQDEQSLAYWRNIPDLGVTNLA